MGTRAPLLNPVIAAIIQLWELTMSLDYYRLMFITLIDKPTRLVEIISYCLTKCSFRIVSGVTPMEYGTIMHGSILM